MYLDCSKIHCLIDEEDVKKACEKAHSRGATVASNHNEEQEEEVEVDVNLFPEKEKNKIIILREKEAHKAKDKVDKEAL